MTLVVEVETVGDADALAEMVRKAVTEPPLEPGETCSVGALVALAETHLDTHRETK